MKTKKKDFYVESNQKIICKTHGEVIGSVFKMFNNLIEICPLCSVEQEKLEERKREEQERKKTIAFCKNAGIKKEFYFKTIDDYKPLNHSQIEAKEAVCSLISGQLGKIVLLGPNGIGKTHLATSAIKKIGGGLILSMYELTIMIRDSYHSNVLSEKQIMQKLATTPLLVIDELGRTGGSVAEMNWLSHITNERHTEGLPLIILSNKHLSRECLSKDGCEECIENFIADDSISRLQQDCRIITMSGKDQRQGACNGRF